MNTYLQPREKIVADGDKAVGGGNLPNPKNRKTPATAGGEKKEKTWKAKAQEVWIFLFSYYMYNAHDPRLSTTEHV